LVIKPENRQSARTHHPVVAAAALAAALERHRRDRLPIEAMTVASRANSCFTFRPATTPAIVSNVLDLSTVQELLTIGVVPAATF